jgi:penicillin amidase
MPAILIGRNQRVAWGITNNICSQRDLYQERIDDSRPGYFQFDGRWEPARELDEVIEVKGGEPVRRTIRFSRNGPIVDEILPPPANQTGPVSLTWLGAYHGGWLTALLAMNRASNISEFRQALRPWHVPTFNFVIADVDGHIAVQSAGRIPLRKQPERGYRPGWDPQHQWIGLLPFEAMPHAIDPARGWLASANNRLAADDYPYPLYGCWISGHRAMRIRQMIESGLASVEPSGRRESSGQPRGFAVDDFRRMQHDTISLRAVQCVPPLLAALEGAGDPRVQEAISHLRSWDGRVETDFVAPTLFNVFFTFWAKAVADARFQGATAELLARQAEHIASRLLTDDPHGWFPPGEREPILRRVFSQMLDQLEQKLGPNMSQWQWGRLHRMPLKHILSSRGDLAQLLDDGGGPVKGDMITVCNTGSGPQWLANTGAGYRMICDLSADGLWAIDCQSQSGQPATPHYSDQLPAWTEGEYHFLPLAAEEVSKIAEQSLTLLPATR